MGIFDKLARALGAKPKAPVIINPPAGMGHRGIAARNLRNRYKQAERFYSGETEIDARGNKVRVGGPYTEEEMEKWHTIPADEVESFLNGDIFVPVHSSNVAGFQYNPENQTLMVEFLNQSAYLYKGVTRTEALLAMTANSKGSYVWTTLRNKKPTTRIR